MSLSIFEYGDGRFRLFHGDREVGWVEERAIGFVGWDSEGVAIRAATVAYDALSEWLARQRRQEIPRRVGRRLRARNDAPGERALTLGDVAIGQLIEVSMPAGSASRQQYGFELTLPPRIGGALTAAQIVDTALRRHQALAELENAGSVDSNAVA